nr:MAG TPA: hypothetical protein [Caudoviricetes sp.]
MDFLTLAAKLLSMYIWSTFNDQPLTRECRTASKWQKKNPGLRNEDDK